VILVINDIFKAVKGDLIEIPPEGAASGGGVKATANVSATVGGDVGISVGASAAGIGRLDSETLDETVDDTLESITEVDVATAFGSSKGGQSLEKLQEENNNLKQELDQLKSQIDNMNERVNELKKERNLQVAAAGEVESKNRSRNRFGEKTLFRYFSN